MALGLAACDFASEPSETLPATCHGLPDGTRCNDGNRCTEGDVCAGGACVPTGEVVCPPSGCRVTACQPRTGLCETGEPLPDGALCDDADPCTRADACLAGACTGVPVDCSSPDDCHLDAECDPATGRCGPNEVAADGTPCEDGDLCTIGDTCGGGACVTGQLVDCEINQCVSGACDPSSGRCSGVPLPDGTPCDDGTVCTIGEVCLEGACVGAHIPCETDEPCLVAGCHPVDGCRIELAPNGAACEDGNACTTGEQCTDGACGGGVARNCEAPNDCLMDGMCMPDEGCIHARRPDGTPCNDTDLCTSGDACEAGVCVGTPIACVPPGDCQVSGTCDPGSGACTFTQRPDGSACDDTSACTQTDVCQGGTCVGTDPIVFEGTPCENGICFTDVTAAAGITFTSTASGTLMIGAGGAFVDYDGDGWLDILVGTERSGARLYRNLGDGTFADTSAKANLPHFFLPDRLMGFSVGDYDDDGDPDVYFLAYGPNVLMRNQGDGTFQDVTSVAHVGDPAWSTAGAFGDYDGDGDLDLYVGNYIAQSSFPNHTPHPNRLYRNEGDGTFTDVGAALGVAGAGTTLAVSWSDYDADGDPDLFVCNDFGAFVQPNRLYRNDGGAFLEVSAAAGANAAIYCMGIAAGDYDRDGDLDYYFSNLGRNVFLENQGAAGFADVTDATGTTLTNDACFTQLLTTSWGVGFHDFDQDGHVDLYVSNGWVPAAPQIANAEESPNTLFKNDGAGGFADISDSALVKSNRIGRGVAFGDFDRDGDLDVFQVNVGGPPILYRNDSPTTGGYLQVDVVGRLRAREAAGTRLEAMLGSVTLVREVNRGYSFESASQATVHFGLSDAPHVDRLIARYPSGAVQDLVDVPADMRLTIVEPFVTITQASISPSTVPPGGVTDLSFTLSNDASTTQTVDWTVRLDGLSGGDGTSSLAGGGTQVVTVQVTAPANPGTIPLLVTVGDAGGGVDQTRIALPVQ